MAVNYKGGNAKDVGVFYAPYVPLTQSGTLPGPSSPSGVPQDKGHEMWFDLVFAHEIRKGQSWPHTVSALSLIHI